jgi:hypothetical protein
MTEGNWNVLICRAVLCRLGRRLPHPVVSPSPRRVRCGRPESLSVVSQTPERTSDSGTSVEHLMGPGLQKRTGKQVVDQPQPGCAWRTAVSHATSGRPCRQPACGVHRPSDRHPVAPKWRFGAPLPDERDHRNGANIRRSARFGIHVARIAAYVWLRPRMQHYSVQRLGRHT